MYSKFILKTPECINKYRIDQLKKLIFWGKSHNFSTSNDIHTAGARAKTGGHKGTRGDRGFKGRGGYPMETSYHFIHQNTNICRSSIFRESYMK